MLIMQLNRRKAINKYINNEGSVSKIFGVPVSAVNGPDNETE